MFFSLNGFEKDFKFSKLLVFRVLAATVSCNRGQSALYDRSLIGILQTVEEVCRFFYSLLYLQAEGI